MAIAQQRCLHLNNMAISQGAFEAALTSKVSFDRSSEHYKGDLMLVAISAAVYSEFTGKAKITVNAGGGSAYTIEGIDKGALAAAIVANLSLELDGEFAKGNAMVNATASGVAEAISAATVTVPSMTAGVFPVKGFESSQVRSVMRAKLTQSGFNLDNQYSHAPEMIDAIADGVTEVVLSSAQYAANGVSGGVFLMI